LFAFAHIVGLVWQMKDDQQRFLSVAGLLPVRLNAEQAGWVLNCQSHDIPALVHARLIKPLGNPAPNSTKYFCTADILETAKDRAWLVKMTAAINSHWQKQNAKQGRGVNETRNGHAVLEGAKI
jgi:hypothetical protein